MLKLHRIMVGLIALSLCGLLIAPHRAAAQQVTKTYQVTITNITNSMQGLSPLIVAAHPPTVHAWQLGQPASKGQEMLAEEGMPDMLASELQGSATDIAMTNAHLLPGDTITVTVKAKDGDVLSAASMLIQTNDGFTGLDSVPLVDGTTETVAYDAGTEDNSELKTDVPGPPFGGKMHGPDTTPHQPISMHPGIQGTADVTPDFKWTGPVARFTIHQVDAASLTPAAPAFDVTISNINTGMQVLSPPILATHPQSGHGWQAGQLASKGLELVAEEGMPDMLASELQPIATDIVASHAHLLPGDSITIRISAKPGDVLSAASMLIQTNDGFTGLDGVPLTNSDVDAMAYDAGTEDNSELKTDVPGPPFGGKMHGPDTTPHQPISMHPGIQGTADVTPDFKWTGPVAHYSIRAVAAAAAPTAAPAAPTTPAVAASPTASSGTGSGATPGMPHTGSGGADNWMLAAIAGVFLLAGIALRRTFAVRRR